MRTDGLSIQKHSEIMGMVDLTYTLWKASSTVSCTGIGLSRRFARVIHVWALGVNVNVCVCAIAPRP